MSSKVKLEDVASVQIGYQHRERIDASTAGGHRIIQIKDITAADELCADNLCTVTPRSAPDRYLVNQGDVLFLSRGRRCFAVAVLERLEDTIAAYYFYIVRLRAKDLLPAYLAWFMNQNPAQRFLEKRMSGSHIKMVTKSAFAMLEINVPSVTTQESIVELELLRRKEEACLSSLVLARKRLVQGLSLKAARET